MQLTISNKDYLEIAVATGDIHCPSEFIGSVTSDSSTFVVDDGWIKVEGDKATLCPYINGQRGTEHIVSLKELVKEQTALNAARRTA